MSTVDIRPEVKPEFKPPAPVEALEPRQKEQLLSVMPNGQLDIVSMGKVLAQSGYFKDIKSLSQGIVKIMLGQELGLGPLMSIMKLYIVKENPVISANLMASRIRQSGVYDYEVLALDGNKCRIRFSRKKDGQWKVLTPELDFTLEDAMRAQLGGWNSQYNPKKGKDFDPESNWAKWPRNMLFARCMSDGYRFHCPDVFSMSVYTPADFEVSVDAAGEIMRDVTPSPEPVPLVADSPAPAKATSAIDRIVQQKQAGTKPPIAETKPDIAETATASSETNAAKAESPDDVEISDDDYIVITDAMNAAGLKLGDIQTFMRQNLNYKKGLVKGLKHKDLEAVLQFIRSPRS